MKYAIYSVVSEHDAYPIIHTVSDNIPADIVATDSESHKADAQALLDKSHEFAAAQCSDDQDYAVVGAEVENNTHYIKADTLKANRRDSTPATPSTLSLPADGTSALTLSQMRVDTQITITGPVNDTLTVPDGGSETLTFTAPGVYTLRAQAPFPALPKEIVIHAV